MNNPAGKNSGFNGAGNRERDILSKPEFLVSPLIIASVIASLVSVAASGIFLGLGLIAWFADCVAKRRVVARFPAFKWYFLLFFLLTAVSALFSAEPLLDLRHLKSLIKFIIPFLLVTYMTRGQSKNALLWIFGVAGVSMLWGLMQYGLSDGVDLLQRIDGFMSHWMTFSGQLMMVLIASAAYGIHHLKSGESKRRLQGLGWMLFSAVMAGTVVLTYTRSAWGGVLGGLVVLAVLNLKLKWTALLAAVMLLSAFMMPVSVHERLASGFDLEDTTTRGRLDIWRSGILVALEHPLTGAGYSSVAEESFRHRKETDLPAWAYQHSHNNLIQTAATSGIPALIAWIAMWLKMFWDFFRIRHFNRGDKFVAIQASAGISILTAFHLMGLLEFNFGDSEVLTLLLFFISVPYAVQKSHAPGEGHGWGERQCREPDEAAGGEREMIQTG